LKSCISKETTYTQNKDVRRVASPRKQHTLITNHKVVDENTECWKCNNHGHIVRFCKNLVCYKCNIFGHKAQDCKISREASKKSNKVWKRKQEKESEEKDQLALFSQKGENSSTNKQKNDKCSKVWRNKLEEKNKDTCGLMYMFMMNALDII